MASQLSVSVKKRRKRLSAPARKHRKDVANSFNCQCRKLDANLPDDEPIPFNGRVPSDELERKGVIDMLLAEKGFVRAAEERKCRELLRTEINKITSAGCIELHPITDFNKMFLRTGETHESPVNGQCELDTAHVMGFVPKELLAALLCNFKEGNDKCFDMIANSHGQNIEHAPSGTGWCKMLEIMDLKDTHVKIDSQVNIMSEAFKNLFVQAFLHKNRVVTKEELDKWNGTKGLVGTKVACHQNAHTDINEEREKEDLADIFILHMPLQEEGALLSLRDIENYQHKCICVPFGTFVALRADVCHGGFHGNPGNARFHMMVERGPRPDEDELTSLKCDTERLNAARDDDWQSFFDFHVRCNQTIAEVHKEEIMRMFCGARNYSFSNFKPKKKQK